MNQEIRTCQSCKNQFTIEPEDFDFYEKIKVPPPTFCPDCRKQRRLSWRNDLNLYSRTCNLCKKSVVSIYDPDVPFPVYCQKCWWSDKWDPKEFGRDYDFSKNFFVQYKELQNQVPALSMVNDNEIASVNCEYTHDFAFGKNCYMTIIAWKVEECSYNVYIINGREIVDSLNSIGDCEFIYETVYTEKCYQCKYVYYSLSLINCAFCYDCRDCSDCFMCVGLRHKKYCFKNVQYSKEEYEKILKEYPLDTFSGVERSLKEFEPMILLYPRKYANQRNCVNCTGDGLINGKNSKYCFNVQRPENCKWIENSDTPKDSYDLSVGGELEQCYEGITPDHSHQGFFAIFSWKNTNVAYVDGCHSSQNLFGCCGLKNAQYCILNKQYPKEEYLALVKRIKDQMNEIPYADKNGIQYRYGEFFPSELSYFGYNQSVAQDYFPLSKDEIEKGSFKWQDNFQFTKGKETFKIDQIPDSIIDVNDSITQEVLACLECGRNYKIVPQELRFYKKMKIPIPRRCFYCRHNGRFLLRNPFKLFSRGCDCNSNSSKNKIYSNTAKHFHDEKPCPNLFNSPYSPSRPEIVYCEQCYNAEIA